jgi:hypothetical protein
VKRVLNQATAWSGIFAAASAESKSRREIWAWLRSTGFRSNWRGRQE